MHWVNPTLALAAALTLAPLVAGGFFSAGFGAWALRLPGWLRLLGPATLCVPYALVATWRIVPVGLAGAVRGASVAVAGLLRRARRVDAAQRGSWMDFVVLAGLGLAVDLRWLERAWPAHLAVFSKMLLLDAGIYGFLVMRRLDSVGLDLRLRGRDLAIGLREFAWYAPVAIGAGLALGFLHWHAVWRGLLLPAVALFFTFFFIAVPEELFFRGWTQNLLERRMGRTLALLTTSVLFGLSHFNKRAAHFNWRYVVLAAVAGIAYGRAWRQDRRVGASAVTHALVDTVWSQWLR
jgi:membrane protease YdiL (CAAX protease family)